jgi:hypothetical protein
MVMKPPKTNAQDSFKATPVIERNAVPMLTLPFDMARALYASAVHIGAIERSMLAWARFEGTVDALEKLALGPWARRV